MTRDANVLYLTNKKRKFIKTSFLIIVLPEKDSENYFAVSSTKYL